MTDLVFFYGTLMRGYQRHGRTLGNLALEPLGHGWIQAALFDLGTYPAAIPATDSRVRGELHRVLKVDEVLPVLDDFEDFHPDAPDASLYVRRETSVTRDDGLVSDAWVYFYNAPLGRAARIHSGDYLDYLEVKR